MWARERLCYKINVHREKLCRKTKKKAPESGALSDLCVFSLFVQGIHKLFVPSGHHNGVLTPVKGRQVIARHHAEIPAKRTFINGRFLSVDGHPERVAVKIEIGNLQYIIRPGKIGIEPELGISDPQGSPSIEIGLFTVVEFTFTDKT